MSKVRGPFGSSCQKLQSWQNPTPRFAILSMRVAVKSGEIRQIYIGNSAPRQIDRRLASRKLRQFRRQCWGVDPFEK